MSAETPNTGKNGQDHTSDKPPRRCFIYAIRERVSGRQYVGSAVDYRDRWRHHRWHLNKGDHHCSYLQRAWNKYGRDNFEFLILEELPTNDAEPRRIAELSWIAKSKYYNTFMPGQGGDHFAMRDVVKLKISKTQKLAMLNKPEFAKTRRRVGQMLADLSRTPEAREATRQRMIARWQDPIERQVHLKGLTNRWADPNARDRQSKALTKAHADGKASKLKSEASKALWADPNSGLRNRKQTRWADPEAKKRQGEKMRAYHAARRAARADEPSLFSSIQSTDPNSDTNP